jgi:acetyl-CoA C-acetyltransferase
MSGAAIPDTTPVLVGIGTAGQREDDPTRAPEAMDLMLEAAAAAGRDSRAAATLPGVQWIAVPAGRWSYRNPAAEIALAAGAERPTTVLSSVGVLQQSLINEACERISQGLIHTALVVGGDAGHRLRRAQIAGITATERTQASDPDIRLEPAAELRHPAERAARLRMPVGLYAILDSARRAARGTGIDAHRTELAELGARFSAIAADNPHAWLRRRAEPASIREASAANPMQAFPYTRAHCSNWNVDQAAALLFCSAGRAWELGIARERWLFPLASAESNHMVPVSARAALSACPGAALTGSAVLEAAGLGAADIDLVDLYSCFPIAVTAFAEAIGLPACRDLTVTGGMAFAGGPYNNYLFQATCRAAELLREGKGRVALLSCVSGILTKQAFFVLSAEPSPRGFARLDVSEAVARRSQALDVIERFTGSGRVAGCTVLHGGEAAPRGVLLLDTLDGARALATTQDPGLVARLQADEFVGRTVAVEQNMVLA